MKHSPQLIEQVTKLKQEGIADRVAASTLGLTMHQVQYIKEKAGLGRYSAYLNLNEI